MLNLGKSAASPANKRAFLTRERKADRRLYVQVGVTGK